MSRLCYGVSFIVGLAISLGAAGHGGGLDANGGHHDRKNGGYHCHRAPCLTESTPSTGFISQPKGHAYDRNAWPHWLDTDGDCQNTRHELLAATSLAPVTWSADGCYVAVGEWVGPYSGLTYHNPSDLDIDHVVPLHWAHYHGGFAWSREQRAQFANDGRNLLVVDDGLNQGKGALPPWEWMPPRAGFRCAYLKAWLDVLGAYPDLVLSMAEQHAFDRQLMACHF